MKFHKMYCIFDTYSFKVKLRKQYNCVFYFHMYTEFCQKFHKKSVCDLAYVSPLVSLSSSCIFLIKFYKILTFVPEEHAFLSCYLSIIFMLLLFFLVSQFINNFIDCLHPTIYDMVPNDPCSHLLLENQFGIETVIIRNYALDICKRTN